MPVITFKDLKKAYGKTEVIHGIDLVMNNNEFTVFVGPSGCGKSTTLRMVAGLESISSGQILMDDVDISNLEPINRDIAMVFQDYALYPHMSVEKNMSFGLRLAKYPKKEIKHRVNEVALMLGLTNLLQRKPAQLSGGQRQRVAMGRALVRDSSTLLMDEPLSNLDAKLRGQMRAELSIMREKIDKNIVYVTHDQVEAMTLGDRIVVMQDGKIHQHGTPQELFETPVNKFVAGFMGMPPMNFMPAVLVEQSSKLMAQGEGFNFEVKPLKNAELLPRSGEVYVGFRPSALTLESTQSNGLQTDISVGASADMSGVQPLKMNMLTLPIKVCEYVGAQSVLISEINGSRISVEVNSNNGIKVGDQVQFSVDATDVYLFDRQTEVAIY